MSTTFIGEVQTQIYSVVEIYPNLLTSLFHLLPNCGISCHWKCEINFDKFINSLDRESGTVLNNANKKQSLKLFYEVNSTSQFQTTIRTRNKNWFNYLNSYFSLSVLYINATCVLSTKKATFKCYFCFCGFHCNCCIK